MRAMTKRQQNELFFVAQISAHGSKSHYCRGEKKKKPTVCEMKKTPHYSVFLCNHT